MGGGGGGRERERELRLWGRDKEGERREEDISYVQHSHVLPPVNLSS